MQDYEALRARVEETAKRMKEAQSRRTEGSQSLVEILGALESKFAAQEEELAFYRDRVAPLEHANTRLTELIGKLLQMIDKGFGEDSLEPMRRATAMAAAMLDKDMVPLPTGEPALDEPGSYEDIEPEALAHDAATAEDDLDSLPEVVRLSLVGQPAEAVENDGADDEPPPEPVMEEPAEIEMIAEADDEVEMVEEPEAAVAEPEMEPEAEAEPEPEPEPEPEVAGTVESVEALASALDRKSASGEPLDAGDIRSLLERVEALANQPADDEDEVDIDIPPTQDERREGKAGKTGTHG